MENKYSVPKRQWKKWSLLAKEVFNTLYDYSLNNQSLFTHPKSPIIYEDFWKTVAWNHAWMAAEIAETNNNNKDKE